MSARLDLEQDLEFQRGEWRWQRAGWALLGLVVVLAVAGLLGSGPLNARTAATPDGGLEVRYGRVGRNADDGTLEVRVSGVPPADGRITLELARGYLERVRMEEVSPEPEGIEARAGALAYTFRVDASQRWTFEFQFEFERAGAQEGWVRLGEREVRFGQFVLP